MSRPGFVLEVDRSTPPILFHHGEGFRLERLPAGSLWRIRGAVVRGKGLVNSREQLESLFTAKDLGVASAQEYLAGDSGMKQVQVSRKENVNALAG